MSLVRTAVLLSPLLLESLRGRARSSRPPFNLIISSVTGSRVPLYFNGARLTAVSPLSVPLDGQALNITCTSYAGALDVGITCCARTVPDPAALLEHLEGSLTELEAAVSGA